MKAPIEYARVWQHDIERVADMIEKSQRTLTIYQGKWWQKRTTLCGKDAARILREKYQDAQGFMKRTLCDPTDMYAGPLGAELSPQIVTIQLSYPHQSAKARSLEITYRRE